MKRTLLILALLVVGAGSADALYIERPFFLRASTEKADVGDKVDYTIEPTNDTMAREWAGKTVRPYYGYDDGTEKGARFPLGDAVTLDGKGAGTFTWTVPASVDDKNVVVFLNGEGDKMLGMADLAVGDAEPVARIASGPGGPERLDNTDDGAAPQTPPTRDVPLAPAAGVVALAAAALALRRR